MSLCLPAGVVIRPCCNICVPRPEHEIHIWSMNQMPNWISGIGSLMAGATAVVVLIWQFWRARKGDQEKRDREERDQAGRITWWLEDVPDGDTREGVRDFADAAPDYPELKYAAIFIRNGSEDCIYECSLKLPEFFDHGDAPEPPKLWRQMGVLPPGTTQFRIPVPPQSTTTWMLRTKADLAFNKHVEWVEFRDRINIIWRRLGDGRLEKQPDRPPNTETAYSP